MYFINFSISFSLTVSQSYAPETFVIVKDKRGNTAPIQIAVNGRVYYGIGTAQQQTGPLNSSLGVESFNLTRKGNVFTLVRTGEYSRPITLNASGFSELDSIRFETADNVLGLSALKVVKLID